MLDFKAIAKRLRRETTPTLPEPAKAAPAPLKLDTRAPTLEPLKTIPKTLAVGPAAPRPGEIALDPLAVPKRPKPLKLPGRG